jgi:hypothetical protein
VLPELGLRNAVKVEGDFRLLPQPTNVLGEGRMQDWIRIGHGVPPLARFQVPGDGHPQRISNLGRRDYHESNLALLALTPFVDEETAYVLADHRIAKGRPDLPRDHRLHGPKRVGPIARAVDG